MAPRRRQPAGRAAARSRLVAAAQVQAGGITVYYPRAWDCLRRGEQRSSSAQAAARIMLIDYGTTQAGSFPPRPDRFDLDDDDRRFLSCVGFEGWNVIFTDRGQAGTGVRQARSRHAEVRRGRSARPGRDRLAVPLAPSAVRVRLDCTRDPRERRRSARSTPRCRRRARSRSRARSWPAASARTRPPSRAPTASTSRVAASSPDSPTPTSISRPGRSPSASYDSRAQAHWTRRSPGSATRSGRFPKDAGSAVSAGGAATGLPPSSRRRKPWTRSRATSRPRSWRATTTRSG